MKESIERRVPEGIKDHIALAITTCGVGYLPLAPGTWGSMFGVAIYVAFAMLFWEPSVGQEMVGRAVFDYALFVVYLILLIGLCILGMWAAGIGTQLLGNSDPSEAVIDEVVGQLITFVFVPFTIGWQFILIGFLLFRLFDIWKPYPINDLQGLPDGIGVVADDVLAGVYAGVCLAIIYAGSMYLL